MGPSSSSQSFGVMLSPDESQYGKRTNRDKYDDDRANQVRNGEAIQMKGGVKWSPGVIDNMVVHGRNH